MKNLGKYSYARNFKKIHQLCKMLQSTEVFGRSRKLFCETDPWILKAQPQMPLMLWLRQKHVIVNISSGCSIAKRSVYSTWK
jgi:hypothetical protein